MYICVQQEFSALLRVAFRTWFKRKACKLLPAKHTIEQQY